MVDPKINLEKITDDAVKFTMSQLKDLGLKYTNTFFKGTPNHIHLFQDRGYVYLFKNEGDGKFKLQYWRPRNRIDPSYYGDELL